MKTLRDEVISAVGVAIEGREWLIFKWEGGYGDSYPRSVRDFQISKNKDEVKSLRKLRARIKKRKRL